MTNVLTVEVDWIGSTGDAAMSRFYFRSTDAADFTETMVGNAQGTVNAYLAALENLMSVDFAFSVRQVSLVNVDTTGAPLADIASFGPYGTHAGTSSNGFARGSGLRTNWVTATIRDGRHVHGGWYLVPCQNGAFDDTGKVSNDALTELATQGGDYITGANTHDLTAVVWSKPRAAKASYTRRGITYPAVTARAGLASDITAASPDPKPAGLRKRR